MKALATSGMVKTRSTLGGKSGDYGIDMEQSLKD
ncbi:hypothetical protein AWB79_05669 [Caballeronia hypogeia]|uniref:Uncharacterized protein n=1 Tax=Caballeronia hypogeia TaxID=1777140 RepID=A0A158CN42_9BURK|nr:hypothetical protein AWB79_05669 [Caballeronia hypogeia]